MQFETTILKGSKSSDIRGTVHFVNQFDMVDVRRFYIIDQSDTSVIRGWRGHRKEQRWFKVLNGMFLIKIVKIDKWESPSVNLIQQEYILSSDDESVLHIPKGYASSIQALAENSKLLVFADSLLKDSINDDYLFPLDHFDGI
jgi:dTDP-4-dehydrorhamnose 3,5-epimerase-like enzyme